MSISVLNELKWIRWIGVTSSELGEMKWLEVNWSELKWIKWIGWFEVN